MALDNVETGRRTTIGIDARAANQPNLDGAGNYCHELLRALAPLAKGVQLRIYLDKPPIAGFPLTSADADFRILPPGALWTQRALARDLRRDPPDVFFTPGLQIPVLCRCPRAATVLDLAFFDFGAYFTWRFRLGARIYTRLAVRFAAHLFAISQATKDDAVRLFRIPDDRITVTPLAASSHFRPDPDEAELSRVRSSHRLPERFILYVGRLQPRKNLERVIDAFSRLRARRPDLPHHLVIAGGRGWLFDGIYRAAQSSPSRDFIRFLDYVPEQDLRALISDADALILVSLWEGFGLPLVEAMACGTAAITSNCSSLPEVAGDAALLVDPYDTAAISEAMERLVSEDGFRCDIEARGRVQAARFTWEKTAQQTFEVLARLAGRDANGPARAGFAPQGGRPGT